MAQHNSALAKDIENLGRAATVEENNALYPRVKAGDSAAIRKMIESNMALVVWKVKNYIHAFPATSHLADDMVSEGLMAITEAVNRMVGVDVRAPNPTGYMSFWIKKAIGMVVDGEQANGACPRTVQGRRSQSEELPHLVGLPIDLVELQGLVDADLATNQEYHIPDSFNEEIDPTAELELRDLIASCCLTDEDRMIVDMREKGYTDEEIGQSLNIPKTTAYRMRQAIYKRYQNSDS